MPFNGNIPPYVTLQGSDVIKNSRVDINDNFSTLYTYATETSAGISRLATEVEIETGTGQGIITPENLAASVMEVPLYTKVSADVTPNASYLIVNVEKLNNAIENVPVMKMWINFNGTGTIAIRESYNVLSIQDLGTGQYRVNYTSKAPHDNYATFVSTGDPGSSAGKSQHYTNRTTSYIEVVTRSQQTGISFYFSVKDISDISVGCVW